MKISAQNYCLAAMALIGGCIVTTTVIYKAQGGEGLPTMSTTWEKPPGSYLSRFCISNGVVMLSILQLFLYYGGTKQLGLGLAACFCLSWVGAICDSTICDGNNTLHSCFATSFFVLYDTKMLLTAKDLPFSVASSSLTLLRFISNDAWTAVFEWCNVSLVMVWTYRQLPTNLEWRFGDNNDLLWSMPNAKALRRTVELYVGTLIVTCIFAVALHQVPTVPNTLWYISDMWTQIPGAWISRWAVPLGAHFGWLTVLGMIFDTASRLRRFLLVIAAVGLVGLSIVGCCDEVENLQLHTLGASIYFYSMDIYILGTLLSERKRGLVPGGLLALTAHVTRSLLPTTQKTLDPYLEWMNALGIIVFVLVDADETGSTLCLGIGETDELMEKLLLEN